MRVSFADAGLAALDGLEGFDALCLFVPEDERPLRGAAGYVDWRLCGALSRVLLGGRFQGAAGDALLLPSQGRLPAPRIFCFGAGRSGALDSVVFATLVRKACEAMTLAGSRAFVTELPQVRGLDDAGRAAQFLTEGAARLKAERLLLLGDGRGLARAFQGAGTGPKGLVLDKEPLGFGAAPVPAGSGAKLPSRRVSG